MKNTTCLMLVALSICAHARDYHIDSSYVKASERKSKLMYPVYDQCSARDDLQLQFDFFDGSMNWSQVLNVFHFYTFNRTTTFGEELVAGAFPAFSLFCAIFYWICFYSVYLLLSTIFIPILGGICFISSACVVYGCLKAAKIIGRRGIINFEKVRRARERIILPGKQRYYRRRFRMPVMFREYSDEEIPKELEVNMSSEDSSNDEEEDDKFLEELERFAQKRKFSVSWTTVHKKMADKPQHHQSAQVPEKQTAATEIENAHIFQNLKPKNNQMVETERTRKDGGTETDLEGSDVSSSNEGRDSSKGWPSVGVQTKMGSAHRLMGPESRVNLWDRPQTAALNRQHPKPHGLAPDINETKSHVGIIKEREERLAKSKLKKITGILRKRVGITFEPDQKSDADHAKHPTEVRSLVNGEAPKTRFELEESDGRQSRPTGKALWREEQVKPDNTEPQATSKPQNKQPPTINAKKKVTLSSSRKTSVDSTRNESTTKKPEIKPLAPKSKNPDERKSSIRSNADTSSGEQARPDKTKGPITTPKPNDRNSPKLSLEGGQIITEPPLKKAGTVGRLKAETTDPVKLDNSAKVDAAKSPRSPRNSVDSSQNSNPQKPKDPRRISIDSKSSEKPPTQGINPAGRNNRRGSL